MFTLKFSWVKGNICFINVNKNNVTLHMNVSVWLNLFLYKREKEIKERERSYVFSSRTLYCSSPRPPSTSWSSFVISSLSNCKARTDSIKLWPTFNWRTKRHTYSQWVCLQVTTYYSELFTQTDTRLSDRTDLYLSFLHSFKRAGYTCSALNSNLSGIYSLCQWERFYSVIWAVQH